MMRQVIEMAYQAKQERLDPVAVKKMKDFIRENILIEKGE